MRLRLLAVRRTGSAAELFPKVLPHSLWILYKLTENQGAKAVECLLPKSFDTPIET